jgi:hypothetical protein
MVSRFEKYLEEIDERNADIAADDDPQEEEYRESGNFVADLKEGIKMMKAGEKMVRSAAEKAVGSGITWGQIGGLLGLPGEVARQRYGHTPNPGNVALGSGIPDAYKM